MTYTQETHPDFRHVVPGARSWFGAKALCGAGTVIGESWLPVTEELRPRSRPCETCRNLLGRLQEMKVEEL